MANPEKNTTHCLKTTPPFFQHIQSGAKPFELRKDDREFLVGDTLVLQEYNPDTGEYTGRTHSCNITYLLRGQPWLADGYVAMGLENTHLEEANQQIEQLEKQLQLTRSDRDKLHNEYVDILERNTQLQNALKACWDVIELANEAHNMGIAGHRVWTGYSNLTASPNPIMPNTLEKARIDTTLIPCREVT